MPSEYQDYFYSNVDKAELIKISTSNFSILKNSAVRLLCIIINNNCDNDILDLLIKNQSTPFDKLEARILDGVARFEITTIPLLLLAIKRFKNNKDFMQAIKYNANYQKFIVMQQKEVDDFNEIVALHIKELGTATILKLVEDIKIKKTLLERRRIELIQQYPDIEERLLSISELNNAIIAAKIRLTNSQARTRIITSFTSFTPIFNRASSGTPSATQRNESYTNGPQQPVIVKKLRSTANR